MISKKIFREFRTFISRGSVIDLAIGVIIGGAFGKIVSSIISDIVMPPIGLLISGIDFKEIRIIIGGSKAKPVAINIGDFIQQTFEFLILAFVVFILVKAINSFNRRRALETPPPEPSEEVKILAEIRDMMKKKNADF